MGKGEGVGGIIVGIILLAVGIWLGFIGWTSYEWTTGPEGYGLYEIKNTIPVLGIFLIVFGIIALIGGFVTLAEGEKPVPPPQMVAYQQDSSEEVAGEPQQAPEPSPPSYYSSPQIVPPAEMKIEPVQVQCWRCGQLNAINSGQPKFTCGGCGTENVKG